MSNKNRRQQTNNSISYGHFLQKKQLKKYIYFNNTQHDVKRMLEMEHRDNLEEKRKTNNPISFVCDLRLKRWA